MVLKLSLLSLNKQRWILKTGHFDLCYETKITKTMKIKEYKNYSHNLGEI